MGGIDGLKSHYRHDFKTHKHLSALNIKYVELLLQIANLLPHYAHNKRYLCYTLNNIRFGYPTTSTLYFPCVQTFVSSRNKKNPSKVLMRFLRRNYVYKVSNQEIICAALFSQHATFPEFFSASISV